MRALGRTIVALLGSVVAVVLTLPVLLAAAPFACVALATRAIRRLIEPRAVHWSRLVEFMPTIGWRPRPNVDARAWGGDTFHVRTDADGWRGRCTLDESDVVVFGDSFAFGHGVDEDDFYAHQAGALAVKPIGVNGYNMVQSLLWMRELAPRLAGKSVVWFVYYGNDLEENTRPNMERYRAPFVRERPGAGWEIVTEHVTAEPWSSTTPRQYYHCLAAICGPGRRGERAMDACEYLIAEGRSVCEAVGARLAVVGIPDPAQLRPDGIEWLRSLAPDPAAFDPRWPDWRLAEICDALEVPFVALADHLEAADYKANDVHWTARGHRRVAVVLATLHEQLRSRARARLDSQQVAAP